MVQALTHTNLGGSLVLHCANREGHGWESFVDLDEKGARTLHLQVVDLVELALEHGAASLVLLGLALASRYVHVELEDVTWSKLVLLHALSTGLSVNDDLVAVDRVLLDLVREDALHGIALELLGNLLDDSSHVVVGGANTDLALSCLESLLGSQDDIGLASSDGTIADGGGRCSAGSIAIEVGSANTAVKEQHKQL